MREIWINFDRDGKMWPGDSPFKTGTTRMVNYLEQRTCGLPQDLPNHILFK